MEQNRQNFLWRPNDNSSQTNIRYDLEAAHWVKAFKNASAETNISLVEFLGVFGLLLSLAVNIIVFIVMSLIKLINLIIRLFKPSNRKNNTPEHLKILSDDEISEICKKFQ